MPGGPLRTARHGWRRRHIVPWCPACLLVPGNRPSSSGSDTALGFGVEEPFSQIALARNRGQFSVEINTHYFTHPILPLGAAFVVEEFFYRIERLLGILSRIQIGNKIGKSKIGVRMVDIVLEKCAILTISGDTYGDRLDKTSAVSLLQRILRISAHALKYCECRLCGMRKIDTARNQRE